MKRVLIPNGVPSRFIHSLPEAATAALAANILVRDGHSVIILVEENIPKAEEWGEDVASFVENLRPGIEIEFHLFDSGPPGTHPDAFEKTCDRLAVLSSLIHGNEADEKIILIATTPEALVSACPKYSRQKESELILQTGQNLNFDDLCNSLVHDFDYSSEILCEEPGQFAVRGGLIDVYPVNGTEPVRIDFFGNEIEEIRVFDPTSQRGISKTNDVTIASAKSNQESELEGEFFNYLSMPVAWIFREPEQLVTRFPLVFHTATKDALKQASFANALKRKCAKMDIFLGTSEIHAGAGIFDNTQPVELPVKILDHIKNDNPLMDIGSARFESEKKYRTSYLFDLLSKQDDGHEIIIAAGAKPEQKRIQEIIEDESSLERLNPRYLPIGLKESFIVAPVDKNDNFNLFIQNNGKGLVIATAREILGRERSRRPIRSKKAIVRRKEVDQALDFSELVEGDYLVHHQHGICQFIQLGEIDEGTQKEEAVTLEFADGLLLHVPLQESHLLSRYIGLQKARPKLAKLGGKAWAKTKQAAEMAALDLAADLLRLQATRDTQSGHAFPPDEQWQKEFEDSFPFTETVDQLKAIIQVKEDMEKEQPMDRLVCGDVGFGKTEVALRAAFKAVMDGKQVAFIAPTTILCQQHLNLFRDRMSDYPIAIEMLSRFRTPGQQKKIIKATSAGSVDIVIGTHRMFSEDVLFKDLGLLVIDEEQRFGVQHKESIKKMRANVDVLTLSATPIPRTLYFAMVGARALSTIETAPVNRRPIRTVVSQNVPDIITQAVQTEVRRGGQIFYLHNRVKTIYSVAKKLETKFPKIRIGIGHGQMSESELEEVMTDFVAHRFDILVCTTIIESGLDIPNCNTIIIEGADKFGLSQLYQLRGRVGRFDRQAYAYLLLNRHLTVSDQARKRLAAIRQINNFGAGFRIALRDLELRGAGNLLGSEQSGHVAGIGFELYCRLLRESVSRLKGEELSLRPSAIVRIDFLTAGEPTKEESDENNLLLGSYSPDSYASEPRLRIDSYRKLAQFQDEKDVNDYLDELKDRFGEPPDEVIALTEETKIRCLAEEAGFDLVEVRKNELYCRLIKRGKDKTKLYHRKAGQIPKLSAKDPLLKLNEIIRVLKLIIHGNKN